MSQTEPEKSNEDKPEKSKDDQYCNVASIHGFKKILQVDEEREFLNYGSTLLISGPPGAGKTTFALALVKAMMEHATEGKFGSQENRCIAYYIGSEVSQDRLTNNFREFDWFKQESSSEKVANQRFQFRVEDPAADQTNFYCLTPVLEVDRPVPSPEELVNGIFNRIMTSLMPSETKTEKATFYIIIDSITALLKGCSHPGEERRQTHELLRRLKERFDGGDGYDPKGRLAFTIVLAEQDHRAQETGEFGAPTAPTAPSVEDYLADTVFRLYVRNLPLGKRSRILEVVKSQGANMVLGEHTWQIISHLNSTFYLKLKEFQEEVRKECLVSEESGQWGGIVVFPRPILNAELYHVPSAQKNKEEEEHRGIHGLGFDVPPGSITLIAGPMGCGKTMMCHQFLKARDGQNSFFVTLDVREAQSTGSNDDPYQRVCFPQALFDLNMLTTHLDWLLDHKDITCERLALDGLSEWLTSFNRIEMAKVIEALVVTLKKKRKTKEPPAVFMTYEIGLQEDPLELAPLGAMADNLMVIRAVPINDKLHRVCYMLKHGRSNSPRTSSSMEFPGELRINAKGQIECKRDSLGDFTGLLNRVGSISSATVLMQWFQENTSEQKYNNLLRESLKKQFDKRLDFTFTEFTLPDLGITLDTAFADGHASQSFNVTVHSLDEWWLQASSDSDNPDESRFEKLLELNSKLVTRVVKPTDFWGFEVEKGVRRSKNRKGKKDCSGEEVDRVGLSKAKPCFSWFAIPAYMDFGMFCVDLNAHKDFETQRGDMICISRQDWSKLVNEIPRRWAIQEGETWFSTEKDEDGGTVLTYALEKTGQDVGILSEAGYKSRHPVFTFDASTRETCSCMFFELAWAFGARESFLNFESSESGDMRDRNAVDSALRFLQFLLLEGLMPAHKPASHCRESTPPILFSRHWYSTFRSFQESGLHVNESATRSPHLVILPFMPTGMCNVGEQVEDLLRDILVRQFYWYQRAERVGLSTEVEQLKADCSSLLKVGVSIDELQEKVLEVHKNCHELLRRFISNGEFVSMPTDHKDSCEGVRHSEDSEDLIELLAWNALRLNFLSQSELDTSKYVSRTTTVPHSNFSISSRPFSTGYVCSGSWMYGVARESRSTQILPQILKELSSREQAVKRAQLGAGMPARKDFFHLHGSEPATGASYLTWNELLRFGGSRCRRRDRLFTGLGESAEGTSPDPPKVYQTIYEQVTFCLRSAELYRDDYIKGGPARSDAIKAAITRAESARDKIFTAARVPLNAGTRT